jgi:uncharacterized protein YecE (DUF72 family)
MLLRVGQSPSALAIARYGKHLDLLEVRLDNGAPRRRTLEAMKSESPADLVFAVLVPKRLTSLEQDVSEGEGPALVTSVIETARVLQARWLVARTPSSARPGVRTRERLTQLIRQLEPAQVPIVWEPSGLLAEADAEALAESLGVTLARDPARDDLPEGPVAYGRIQSLGAAGRVRSSALERAAERLAGFEEAYVVLEGDNALRAARDLRGLLGVERRGPGAAADQGAEDEDELEDDDLDDEDEDFEDDDP